MTEAGARAFVRAQVSSIVNPETWARAIEYVVKKHLAGDTWCDIALLIAIDNPFNVVSEG